ncbi:wnk protein kinase [Plasmopara halstedii]|uniref:Wnk protein kinase n=1 Tax=Plasmopara halstedii TaxID=4781 RepID=A0A0P1B1F9_PLAHL|nr:wnk protein kinase [Plasmopara halstedii]CEG48037.1 wnk protein kinase [Plasmopara halstedii]|eukprot:XP_024584406.1 wnk protein kinase [Plasmopara halstedii]
MEESDVYAREEGDRPVEHSPRGRYIRFDIRLGTGAYKSVYKAYDTDQGIDVAWNAIDIGLLPSTEKTRIIQEVQLLQKLEHKNIINFYGSWFSKEKNQVVFITEIMTSGTLKSYIKRVQFIKWKIIKRWCIQILEGLHYLHSQNPPVIHRDLKCDNIFVNGNTGDLRIGDLGLSTQLAVDKRSKAQSVLGTPEFMAPELYDESYDEKVDVYAFGMCVLEMVTKEVPYSECINPAQIYKKVTAGIRPKGLQRVVSQAARDFIELCLSRGNGLVDVTAQYLLDHPFLKVQDDDNDMVECLLKDDLEYETKVEQQRLEKVAEESFAEEFNMEGGSKDGAALALNQRRQQFTPILMEPEAMAAVSLLTLAPDNSCSTIATGSTEVEAAGTHHMLQVSAGKYFIDDNCAPVPESNELEFVNAAQSTAQPSTPPPEAAQASPLSPTQPVISEMVIVDEPLLSGKQIVDTHVDQFLATLPGSESAIQNTRINIMGGRGHRLDLENDSAPEYAENPADASDASNQDTMEHLQSFYGDHPSVDVHVRKLEHPNSAPGLLTPSQAPHVQIPAMQLPEPVFELQSTLVRRASIHAPSNAAAAAAVTAALAEAAVQPSASQQTAPDLANSSSANLSARKRAKRHEIKATKDPDNEHSILLNLRIMIDGKSKEIKFPFNLFADSTHEVTCELAVDVGIREPDLEDIADSIRFLVTEGKINNLSDVQEDVWEEAPEPHSFSSKPFPNVSKMSFVHVPTGVYQQQQTYLVNSTGSDHAPSASSAANSGVSSSVLQSVLSASGTSNSAAPAGGPLSVQELVVSKSQESLNAPSLSDPSSMMMLDKNIPQGNTSNSTSALSALSKNELARSPPRPGLSHTASDSTLSRETLLNILEMRSRGVSLGSIADPDHVQQIHQLEDRLKLARSTFDDRESSLEAAIRSEEEKHQREIERFRKKMEEFDKQRAAIARQQNGEGAVINDINGSMMASLNENFQPFAQVEAFVTTKEQSSSNTLADLDNVVGLPLDGSDEDCSPPLSGVAAASYLASAPKSTSASMQVSSVSNSSVASSSIQADESIPKRYLQSANPLVVGTDTTAVAATAMTSLVASQSYSGQS